MRTNVSGIATKGRIMWQEIIKYGKFAKLQAWGVPSAIALVEIPARGAANVPIDFDTF